ncbi:MAG TPA: NUDIX domain-containing protein [Chryseolinea sp.]|nr:NUDIX domain-containing protein [Chryseolinea sp.]
MAVYSAGLLMCRMQLTSLEFFLVHPGGPFFSKKNEGAWTIPKGLPEGDESMEETAHREFFEETGIRPIRPFHTIGSAKLKSGKTIYAWTFLGTWESSEGIVSNRVEIEWPPRSGKSMLINEIDRAEWMDFDKASAMINPNLVCFLERARDIY